ncbi:hypothetical protein F5883DRAFT_517405 [Diaporthe sp. PMI_573]|nr:hypothetical protein F5883DRAFT_517405 [Diaporthaceae sp. PMI_573]
MLLIMWLLVAFGSALGIATAEYDTSTCSTFATTFATTSSTTLTIPPVTIVKTSTVATVTLSGRGLATHLDFVNAYPSTSSAVLDQTVTVDAWRIETLVHYAELERFDKSVCGTGFLLSEY